MITRIGLALLLLSAVSDEAVAAAMLGQTVRITGEQFTIGTVAAGPTDVVVGAGLEVPGNFWGIFTMDLSDTGILLTLPGTCCGGFTPGTFNGLHFFDLNNTIDGFLGVNIVSNSVAGFNGSRISFDANNIYLNFESLNPSQSAVLSLEVVTAAEVPEPASWLFMSGGAALLTWIRRRRQESLELR